MTRSTRTSTTGSRRSSRRYWRKPPAEPESLRNFLTVLVARMVEFWDRDPVGVRFQVRHWLDTEDRLVAPEAPATLSLYKRIEEVLTAAQQEGTILLDVDAGLFLRGLYMLIHGYFLSGAFDWQTLRGDPHDPAHLQAFKTFLLAYLCRMLNIDSASPHAAGRPTPPDAPARARPPCLSCDTPSHETGQQLRPLRS